MKFRKLLAVALAALMVLALAACGGNNGGNGGNQGGEGGNEGGEQTDAAFTWNGQKEVWAILPTTGVPGLMMHADSMGWVMEQQGWKYVPKDAEGNPANQVTFVEDAIAAEYFFHYGATRYKGRKGGF